MTPELDEAIRGLLCRCFPADAAAFSVQRAWHNCVPAYSMVARDDKSVVGHVGIVIREIRCGDLHVKVAGVQSLGVVPEWRGTGLAQQLMVFAMKQAMSRPLSFGLLFCVPELERFYGSLGWVRTDQRPSMLDERGMVAPLPEHNIAMFMELAGTKFPGGPIDLQGRDW